MTVNLQASLMRSGLSLDRLTPVLAALEAEAARRKARNRLATYQPYSRQRLFHTEGRQHRERLFMAGNQLGKTIAGGAEAAIHLTGRYPDWWDGHRFDRPIKMWAASDTGSNTRDNVQAKLIGPPEQESEWGTGFIPADCLVDTGRALGTPNLLDHALVRHVSGGVSTVGFKTYEQGRQRWQGATLDLLWCDEEPPLDIYMEGLTRTNAVPDGRVYITFTPLLGVSEVVQMFLQDDEA